MQPGPFDIAVALLFAGSIYTVVDLGSSIECLGEVTVSCCLEQAHRGGVVEHLESDGTFGGVPFHSFHPEHRAALAFLII